MEKFFKLKENKTTVSTEVMAGITTFFAMAYIIAVNPNTLSQAGMEWGAVFLATIISAIIGTLIMGLVANVPYAQAPGMGLNLAAGAVDGVHLRSDQHLHHGDEDPQDHHQGDPAVFTECDRWRNRSVHCLSGISECRFYHV